MEGAEYKTTPALEKRSDPKGLSTDLHASLPLCQNSWGLFFICCFACFITLPLIWGQTVVPISQTQMGL